MKDRHIFVDTNILVYAHDRDAGERYHIARERIAYLWNQSLVPTISVQVLQELYVNLVKKNVSAKDSKNTIIDYLQWNVIDNNRSLLLDGIHLREKWKLLLWDALIIAAAKRAKTSIIWSENFNANQIYDGIRIVNPLIEQI